MGQGGMYVGEPFARQLIRASGSAEMMNSAPWLRSLRVNRRREGRFLFKPLV